MTGGEYYRILGVPPSAGKRAIRDAYLSLVKRLHPDRAGPAGTARFQDVTAAYETLSDPVKRRLYDLRFPIGAPTRAPRNERVSVGSQPEPLVPEPIEVLGEPETVPPSFEEFFQRLARNVTGIGVPKWEHLEGFDIGIILTRFEASRGGVLPLVVPTPRECHWCGGVGGTVSPCHACGGLGMVEQRKIVTMHIPPGVRDGDVVEAPLERIGVRNLFLRVHFAVRSDEPIW